MFHRAGILFLAAGLLLPAQQPATSLQDLQARFPGRNAVYTRWEAYHRQGASMLFHATPHTYSEHKSTLILQDDQTPRTIQMDAEAGWTLDQASISWTIPGAKTEQVGPDQLQVKDEAPKKVYSYAMPKLPKGTTLDVAFTLTRNVGLSGHGAFNLPTDAPVLSWHVELAIPDRVTYRVKNPLSETGESRLEERTDPVTLHRVVVVDAEDPGPKAWVPFAPWTPNATRIKWLLPWQGFVILTPEAGIERFAARLDRRDSASSSYLKMAVSRMVQGKATPREKAEAIYAFLQKEVKPIEAGKETGGIFGKGDFKFGEILEKKEGAPEAIAALMSRLLDIQEVPNMLVLVHEGLGAILSG